MFEPSSNRNQLAPAKLARYEVSEDGVTWRPYDSALDDGRLLHRRMEFAPEDAEHCWFGDRSRQNQPA